jgi:hypothetical protein
MRNRFTIPDRTFGLLLTIPAFAVLGATLISSPAMRQLVSALTRGAPEA